MGAPKTFTLVRKTLERMHVIQQKAFQSLRVVTLGLLGVLGRIHLVLKKTLTDNTSVKWAQIKTFFSLIQFC